MTVLAWTIGLGALIECAQYQQYRLTGTSSLLPMEHPSNLFARHFSRFP